MLVIGFLDSPSSADAKPALATAIADLGTLLLLAGILTSGALVVFFPLPEMQSWLAALSERTSASALYEVAALVPWLVLASALFVAAIGTAVLDRPNA